MRRGYNGSGGLRTASIVSNRFLFTGREYAATFGFYEYRARAYHPKLGRFMSEDPKLFDAGDYNLFRYCHNDPLDMTDPMGLETNWAGAGPQNPGNHAAIARLAEIRNLRELTGAGGAISTGMLNYQIGQMQQAMGGLTIAPKESFTASVLTAIHPPNYQAGLKSVQSVTVNSDGSASEHDPYVGYTTFGGKFEGESRGTSANVKVAYPNFDIAMRGHFKSAFSRFGVVKPIDYKVHIGGNFITHKAWAWGKHDGYPSGVVFGGGQRMYEWKQNVRADLARPMEVHFATDAVQW